MLMMFCLLTGVSSGWGQQILYVPKALVAEEKIQKADGVLVQEVTVKKGDTLYGISRTFSGYGYYYPQILLFNDIKDPNKIYPGTIFKVPVSGSGVAGRSVSAVSRPATAGSFMKNPAGVQTKSVENKDTKTDKKHKTTAPAASQAKSAQQSATTVNPSSEQKLYERALKAYRQSDYRAALELFDRFLTDHPSSALAADASLYKAECYLKQSNQ